MVVGRIAGRARVQRAHLQFVLCEQCGDMRRESDCLVNGKTLRSRSTKKRYRTIGIFVLVARQNVRTIVRSKFREWILWMDERTIQRVVGVRMMHTQLDDAIRLIIAKRVVPNATQQHFGADQREKR